jgi:hypothetical protein
MASGGTAAKLRKRHGKKIEVDGDDLFIRSPNMKELRIVDEIRAAGAKGTEDEQAESGRNATAAWFGFVICEDTDGTLSFPKNEGESDIEWAKRVEAELSDVENTTLQAISSKVAKLSAIPPDVAIVKN